MHQTGAMDQLDRGRSRIRKSGTRVTASLRHGETEPWPNARSARHDRIVKRRRELARPISCPRPAKSGGQRRLDACRDMAFAGNPRRDRGATMHEGSIRTRSPVKGFGRIIHSHGSLQSARSFSVM